jgi:hypothetical protein
MQWPRCGSASRSSTSRWMLRTLAPKCNISKTGHVQSSTTTELVVELIRRGADPTLLTEDRDRPLFSARIVRDAEVVGLVLEAAGAQPNEEWDGPEPL